MLRGSLSQDWSSVINRITDDYNNTPLKKIGWLKPSEINTVYDSAKVSQKKLEYNVKTYREPSYSQQNKNNDDFFKKSDLKVGDFVYLDFGENIFGKSFDVQESSKKIHKKLCFLQLDYSFFTIL